MISCTIQIFDKPWTVQLYHPEEYTKLYGENSDGTTVSKGRLINLRTDEMGWDTIFHELCHAATYETAIHQAQGISLVDLEEVYTEFVSIHLFNLLRKVVTIYELLGYKVPTNLPTLINKVEDSLIKVRSTNER